MSTTARRAIGAPGRAVRSKPLLSAAVLVVAVAAIVLALTLGGGSSSGASGASVTTTLMAASTGTVSESVSATGTITPGDERSVSFGSAAQITSVRVTQGQRVVKGQVLGTIATLSLRADLAQSEATLATAEATLSSAEDDSTTTDAQLSADRASVSSAKASVTDARTALADATLRAPLAGTVAAVNVSKGDLATGSGSTSTSSSASGGGASGSGASAGDGSSSRTSSSTTTASTTTSGSTGDFVIVGGRQWTVSASVDDTEVGLIAKGDQVQLTTDNVTGRVFGIVSAVALLSSSSSGSASYPVTIDVTGSPAGLHDGASATVSIIYKQATNVVTVPTRAVHTDSAGSYVYTSSNGRRVHTAVRTGLASAGTTQIVSGLTTGTQVYVQTVTIRTGTSTGGRTRTGTGGNGYFPGGGFPGGGDFPGTGGTAGGYGGTGGTGGTGGRP